MSNWVNVSIELVFAVFFLALGIDFIRHWKERGKKITASEAPLRNFLGVRPPSEEYELFAGRVVFVAGFVALVFSITCFFQLLARFWR